MIRLISFKYRLPANLEIYVTAAKERIDQWDPSLFEVNFGQKVWDVRAALTETDS